MPMMTIMPLNRAVEAAVGASVLQTLLAAGIDAPHKCGGQAKCGTCHIFVHEGRKSLSKVQRLENEKLDSIVGVGSKSRLACQAIIGTENVTIELLGFASGI
jgi:ferredoxin, 2Fe-2S